MWVQAYQMAQYEVVREETVSWCGKTVVGLVMALILTLHDTISPDLN